MSGLSKPTIFSLIGLVFIFFMLNNVTSNKSDSESKEVLSSELSSDSVHEDEETTPIIAEDVTVLRIKDGDTLVVLRNDVEETVRLLLVDSPESVHPEKQPQPYGKDASQYLSALLDVNETVQLELGTVERDKYNRLLGYIWKEHQLINELLVQKGYARVAYINPPNTKYLVQLETAQEQAKEKKRGIWSIADYVTDNGFKEDVKLIQ